MVICKIGYFLSSIFDCLLQQHHLDFQTYKTGRYFDKEQPQGKGSQVENLYIYKLYIAIVRFAHKMTNIFCIFNQVVGQVEKRKLWFKRYNRPIYLCTKELSGYCNAFACSNRTSIYRNIYK